MRILRSLPSDVKQNSIIYNPAQQDMKMKENQNTMVYCHSNYWREVNPLTSEGKDTSQLRDDVSGNGSVFVPFIEFGRRDAARWSRFPTGLSVGNENGSRDSSEIEYPNGDAVERSTEKHSNSIKERSTETVGGHAECASDVFLTNADSCKSKTSIDHGIESNDCIEGLDANSISMKSSSDSRSDLQNSGKLYSDGRSIAEHPLSARFTSFSVEGTAAADNLSNGDIGGQLNSHNSLSQEGNSFGQHTLADKDELNDVSDLLKKDALLSGKIHDQEYKSQTEASLTSLDNGGTVVTQHPSKMTVEMSAMESTKMNPTTTETMKYEQESSSKENYEGQLLDILRQELELSSNDLILNHELGERSFSAASLITYSGPVTQPGSISMRSDGSMSNRSFAFPILPSEWNSSPVRMAKADRCHYRRHRGWRSGLFCCGF